MKLKRFNENNLPSRNSAEERYNLQKQVFGEIMDELKTIMVNNFQNADWGTVASLSHINEQMLNIIEGWNEDKASELRQILNIKA